MQEKLIFSDKNLASGGAFMYIKDRFHQLGLEEFDQPVGLKMNPENRSDPKSGNHPMVCDRGSLFEAVSK